MNNRTLTLQCSGLERTMGTMGVYCTIRIIFYYILIICCFLLPSIISFIIVAIVWVGGNESGTIFVKQGDEYMYRCGFSLPYPFTNPYATVMPNFCNKSVYT